MNLQNNTLLQGGKYRIVGVLGQGGFGITYLAEQPMLERKVCIKEFFFKDYCERDESSSHVTLSTKSNKELVERFRKKFLKEARVISKFHHDHIVQVLDIFEENNTAYYVMDYIEGESLREMIERVGYLPEQKAIEYIKEVASALSYIHAKSINHLDVKPGNIMLRREDQRLLLIDFGVSKQYDDATYEGTTTTPVGISHGYSPAEQYLRHGVQSFSPQSDVYALAATLYKLLTGVTPPEAIVVQEEGLPLAPLQSRNISSSTITAIENAMKSRTQRTQSVDAFVADLDASEEITVVGVTDIESEPLREFEPVVGKIGQNLQPNPQPRPSWLKKHWWTITIVLVTTIICLFWNNSIVMFQSLFQGQDNTGSIENNMPDSLIENQPQVDSANVVYIIQEPEPILNSDSIQNRVDGKVHEDLENPEVQNNHRPDKINSSKPKLTPKEKTKDNLFAEAKTVSDYKKLADKGYKKAYAPLSELYLTNKEYSLADVYAQKAFNSGVLVSRAIEVMKILQLYGYYDDKQLPECLKQQ